MGRPRLLPLFALALAAALPAGARADDFVYVHDRGTPNQVYAFSLAKTGALAPVAGSPFDSGDGGGTLGGLCQTMAADKKSHRLFTSGSTGISVWDVGEDGSLALVPGSPFGATGEIDGVAAVRVGKRVFVYGAEYEENRLRGFEVLADGTLVELPTSPFDAGVSPDGVSAAKRLLFAANEEGTISSYVVAKDGALAPAPGTPLALDPTFVFNVTPSATGKLLYVVDDGFDAMDDANDVPIRVYAFRVNRKTAALAPVPPGDPFDTAMPVATVVEATGASTAKKLLVAFGFEAVNQDMQVFKIGKGGVLAQLGAAQDSGLNVDAHTMDPKGRWLLVASSANLRVSRVDPKTGVVTPVDQKPLGGGDSNTNAVVLLRR